MIYKLIPAWDIQSICKGSDGHSYSWSCSIILPLGAGPLLRGAGGMMRKAGGEMQSKHFEFEGWIDKY